MLRINLIGKRVDSPIYCAADRSVVVGVCLPHRGMAIRCMVWVRGSGAFSGALTARFRKVGCWQYEGYEPARGAQGDGDGGER